MRRALEQLTRNGGQSTGVDSPVNDTSETVHISSLALLKMLKHGMFLTLFSLYQYSSS